MRLCHYYLEEHLKPLQLIHFNQEHLMQVNTSSDSPPLNKEQVLHKYHDVFSGLGKLSGTYRKINELEAMGAIAKVTKPAPWISSMVVVRKTNKLRLCLDPLHLNKGIIRNHYPTPTVEDIEPKLTKATVFSVVHAKDGFLQVVLDEPSSYLTTFWTPLADIVGYARPSESSPHLRSFKDALMNVLKA